MTFSRIAALAALAALSACATVKVEAPDKPIEINLNVKIEHEIRLKIDRELDSAIADDPALFGLPAAAPKKATKAKTEKK